MKILLVNDYGFAAGGSEDYFFNLEDALKRKGHNVVTVSSNHQTDNKLFITDYQILESGHCFNLDSYFNPANYYKFKKILKQFNPDIVHLNNIFYIISPSILFVLKKYKTVMTLHDYFAVCFRDKTFPNLNICHYPIGKICKQMGCVSKRDYIKGKIKRFIIRKGMENIDLFISPSQYLAGEFKKNGFDKIEIMPNPCKIEKQEILINNEKTLIFVGRFAKQKGINYLINAIPEVIKQVPNIVLKIAGEGVAKNELKDQVKKLGLEKHIIFIGWADKEKKKNLYNECIAVMMPSIWPENDPVVKYESAIYGKPLIASNVGGVSEFVKEGETGFLVPPRDSKALAKKIIYVCKNKEHVKKVSKNILKIIPSYSLEKYADKIEKKYLKLLNQDIKIKNKSKILFISESTNFMSGGEKGLLEVISYMRKSGYECILGRVDSKEFIKQIEQNNIPLADIQLHENSNIVSYICLIFKSVYFFKKNKIKLLYINSNGTYWKPAEILAAKILGIPIITHMRWWEYDIKNTFLKHSKYIICNSRYTANKLLDSKYAEKAKIMTNAVNFKRSTIDKNRNKPKWFNVGFVGRIHPIKGLDYLMEAAIKLKEKKDIKILIIGRESTDSPGYLELLKKCCENNKIENVIFCEHTNSIEEIYSKLDVLVLPSLEEPFGRVILEAGYYGVPCIATNVGGIPEIINHKQNGILVESKNSDAIAEAILCLKSDEKLRKILISRLKKDVEEQYNYEDFLIKIKSLIKAVFI